jgi:hypothetical protein
LSIDLFTRIFHNLPLLLAGTMAEEKVEENVELELKSCTMTNVTVFNDRAEVIGCA